MIKILVEEKKQLLTKATWITAIVMLILATIGSYYYGGYGLSVALVFTEILSFIVYSILLVKTGADAAFGASFTSEGVSISASTRSPAAIPECI